MQKFYNHGLLFFALFLLLSEQPLWVMAQPKNNPRSSRLTSKSGLSITSETMTVKGQENKVLFEGNVAIRKEDVTISAGRAEVFLPENAPETSVEAKEISRIEISDNVQVQQGEHRILAQKGVYDAKRGEIVLTGNPEMWQKGNHVKGKRIGLDLVQKKSFVEGSKLTIQ